MKNYILIAVKNKFVAFIIRRFFGYLFIVIGFIGIIMPIMPGWPFIVLGLFIIGGIDEVRKRLIRYLPDKYEAMAERIIEKIYTGHPFKKKS